MRHPGPSLRQALDKRPVRPEPRVLVVGTTSDYVHWIRQSCPGQALFVTDPPIRTRALEPPPPPDEEILCDLTDGDRVRQALASHLAAYRQRLTGIACFDCESMALAATLSRDYNLPYPTAAAVENCRNKYRSKILWQSRHLNTPPVKRVRSATAAAHFQNALKAPVVLKPVSGSGSELVFVCSDARACRQNFQRIRHGLRLRRHQRLYAGFSDQAPDILAEAMIDGQEYSCDFIVNNGQCEVIRLTRKIPAATGPFGTIRAYLLESGAPAGIRGRDFHQTLMKSASALGIDGAVCMLDFIVNQGRMVLLELAPRPGGDCLPFLLRRAYHLDMLRLQIDFARRAPLHRATPAPAEPWVGLRVHAHAEGVVRRIHTEALQGDPRIREVHLQRRPGHRITLPPEDYDTWLLGHVIFTPDDASAVETQCRDLAAAVRVEWEPA
jgi:biotin carboxylase